MGKGGDVFVLDMGEPVRILDLAQNMIRLHGLKPYIMEKTDRPEPVRGDIGIKIVGLNKGEKLYEELLVGDNPSGTEHPRIMCATEVSLKQSELNAYLERLQRACYAFDIATVREIFLEAPLAYQPNTEGLHDLMWAARGNAPAPDAPKLALVEDRP
jgi:FlaA1/EpsC-like NDP-sugar epimerase